MGRLKVLPAVLVAAALAAGCGGEDSQDAAQAPLPTTPSNVRLAVFERSLSSCASVPLEDLAQRHHVDPTPQTVATAVARSWVDRLGAESDAIESGRDGCFQGLEQRGPES